MLQRASFPIITALLGVLASCHVAHADAPHADAPPAAREFFASHCYDCHGDGAAEGGLDLESLPNDLSDEATLTKWVQIYDRVRAGEMPPADADTLNAKTISAFSTLLHGPLSAAHLAHKPTVLRRLNRKEYQNTLNDMFGTNLDLLSMLPEDGRSHEFDNVGEALNISSVQLQRYMEAAQLVLDNSIVTTLDKPASETRRASFADTRDAERFIGKYWHKLDDGAVVFFRQGYPPGMLREANTRQAGWYKIRIHGYAYQSDVPVTFSVGANTYARGAPRPTFGYAAFAPGEPTTVEFEAWIEKNYMVEVNPQGIFDEDYQIGKIPPAEYKGPGLAVLHVELEGPLVKEFPSRGHRLIFDGLNRREIPPGNPRDRQRSWYKPKFAVTSDNPTADATKVLTRVATKAFRRPVAEEEVAPYVALFELQRSKEATFEEALRDAVTAILCSPNFLYLQESPGRLVDYAVAARLSYFLTRSAPDAQLLAAADKGKLTTDRRELLAQTHRLLNGPKSSRFIEDFTDAWLNLREIEFTNPDGQLFPEFDQYLQYSMLQETRGFLRELMDKDLPVANIVRSDFAMLNERLAQHYGIDGVQGPQIRRVRLPQDSPRGGFLSQAATLKVSANGTNTSPVVRGVWVSERILGDTPPPPPADVPGVEPDIRGATTLRELLDKHRDSDNCRSCHMKIDPPGFALECFDPVGRFRDRFRSLGDGDRVDTVIKGRRVRFKLGLPVDASGELPDGREFAGFVEFRDMLAQDKDRLARTLATKLLVFGTGRELGFSDRAELDRIVAESAKNGHGVRQLLELVVTSDIFLTK